VKQLRTPMK